jgi:hypothetical protein
VVLRVQTNLSVSWFGTTVVHEVILKWPVCRETSSTPGLHSLSRRRETDPLTSSRIRPTVSRSVRNLVVGAATPFPGPRDVATRGRDVATWR